MTIHSLQTTITEGLKKLRQERALSQALLARELDVSQATLSLIENGKASLSAEQLLWLIKRYQLTIEDFLPARLAKHDPEDDLQNALERFGGSHLAIIHDKVLPPHYSRVENVVLDTISFSTSTRQWMALASVITRHVVQIPFGFLFQRLQDSGRETRLLWLLRCLLEAISQHLKDHLPRDKTLLYRRAHRVLETHYTVFKEGFLRAGKAPWEDVLIPAATSAAGLSRLRDARDEAAKEWNVLTDLKTEHFHQELVQTDSYD